MSEPKSEKHDASVEVEKNKIDATMPIEIRVALADNTTPPAPPAQQPSQNQVQTGESSLEKAEKIRADAELARENRREEREDAANEKKESRIEAATDKVAAAKVAASVASMDFWLKIVLAFFVIVPPSIASIGSVVAVWRAGAIQIQQKHVDEKLDKYHHEVNSMKDELVTEVRKSSRAEGIEEGRAAKAKSHEP